MSAASVVTAAAVYLLGVIVGLAMVFVRQVVKR
jgi:hypothetical protein